MVTLIGTHEDTVEGLLYNLIELDYDAAEAYEAAINRLENNEYKERLRGFRVDHLHHIENLGQILRGMGKDVPKGPDMKKILTQGKVVIANLFGDKGILAAMKTNEDDTNTAYERALEFKFLTSDIRKTLQTNLNNERTHRAWIEQQIK
jgi:uncharacterized protein (TIGR02284 family)